MKSTPLDVTNTDPKYWEKVLASEQLSEKQLGLEERTVDESTPPDTKPQTARKKSTNNPDFQHLFTKMDSDDLFLTGHQIKKIRTRERDIPSWPMSDTEVRSLIQKAFPNWRTNALQRSRAARWARVIYLFYRMELSYSQIAEEMGVTVKRVDDIIQRQRRIMRGLQGNGQHRRTTA